MSADPNRMREETAMTRDRSARVRARRPLFLGAVALVLTTGTFLACGSDEPNPAPPSVDGGGGDETTLPTDDASIDADATPIDDGGMTNLDAPGDDADAATRQDAAVIEEGGTCPGANPCDCDNDGYEAATEACGGTACDDFDPLRHPNQGYVVEPPPSGADGNWDCKDPIEKQYVVKLNCATLLGLGCPAAQGFRTDPACGTVADYYQCKPGLLSCNPVKIGTRRQGCK